MGRTGAAENPRKLGIARGGGGRRGAPGEGIDQVGELSDGVGDAHAAQVDSDAVGDQLQAIRIHRHSSKRLLLLVHGWLLRLRRRRRLRRRSGGGRHRCAVARPRSASGTAAEGGG